LGNAKAERHHDLRSEEETAEGMGR